MKQVRDNRNIHRFGRWIGGGALLAATAFWGIATVMAATPEELLQQLNAYPHAREVATSEDEVIDHEVGLGAMQKVHGAWRFKHSERYSGDLLRHTWQIVDGYSSLEVMQELAAAIDENNEARLLFECQGRACGHGAQWANRVFQQRILYGRDDLQHYRVYALEGEEEYRMVVYASARTADRQYLHVDLLRIVD
jgi:hypothetical protein